VDSVKTSKQILKMFHHLVAKPFLFFDTERHSNIPMGTPFAGASNAGGIGKNLDSQLISGFAIDNCCTEVSLSHLAAGFLLTVGIGRPSATRSIQSRSIVNPVFDSKARRYAENNRTESNCTHW